MSEAAEGPEHRKWRADRMAQRLRNTNAEDVDVRQLIADAIAMAEQASKECDIGDACIRAWSARVANLDRELAEVRGKCEALDDRRGEFVDAYHRAARETLVANSTIAVRDARIADLERPERILAEAERLLREAGVRGDVPASRLLGSYVAYAALLQAKDGV